MPLPRLTVRAFGAPLVELDGRPVEVDTRKATALLVLLAVTGETHTRDKLAAFLWPDADLAHAQAALRRTLSSLNKALGGYGLAVDRDSIALIPQADLYLDVRHFRSLLASCLHHGHGRQDVCPDCTAPLTEAAGLYRDDFLAGFNLRDAPAFDDWQFFQSEGLRRELSSALERLTAAQMAAGDSEAALASARRRLALDPLDEPAHRLLMRLYTRAGQRTAALRQYRECVRVLNSELGVAPLEATTRLYEEIKGQKEFGLEEKAIPAAPSRPRAPAAPPGPPLVGRAAEMRALTEAYDRFGNDGHLVVIEGEAGIGKTRLAQELTRHAEARGASVLTAQCYEGESDLAFAPLVQALRAALAHRARDLDGLPSATLAEAARLIPEIAARRPDLPPPPPLDSAGAQTRFFEGIREWVCILCAGEAPGIVFVDDLHHADDSSLELLGYLVRRSRGAGPMFVFTWRTGDVPREHRMRALASAALREKHATLLGLSRLTREDVCRWAGDGLADEAAERLFLETEGVPFFVSEYLAALRGDGHGAAWDTPPGVRALIEARLSRMDAVGMQVLAAAAVIGRSFDFDTLHTVSGRSEEETLQALDALIAQGLVREIREASPPAFDFAHEKYRAQVYDGPLLARRRLLHRRAAEALERRAPAGVIAQHYQLAGVEDRAAHYHRLAGDQARALYANLEAAAQYRAALALRHPDAAALHEALGDVLTLAGDYRAALAAYEASAALDRPESLGRLEHKLGNVYLRMGDGELAAAQFESALAALGDSPSGLRARVTADLSLALRQSGRADEARTLAGRAMAEATAADDTHARAQAHNLLGILARGAGDRTEAEAQFEQSRALADALGDASAQAAALNNLALVLRESGEIERAIALTEGALALCAAQGDRHRVAALHNNLADLHHALGQTDRAMTHLKQAVSVFAEIGGRPNELLPEVWKLVEW